MLLSLIGYKEYEVEIEWDDGINRKVVKERGFGEYSVLTKVAAKYGVVGNGTMFILGRK